ncbi:MAG: patatin-like phospholipase family protein, partial [Acidobacteriota bacterium]
MKRAVCVALVCLVLAPLGLGAQPNEPADRPKIGIAFSGGGALGCAHLGVLEVLEEMRVPIDYIAGTSMGSIVGGLYAAGLSTDEMRDALVSTDWSDAFRDKPAREDLSFRRKQEDQRYLLNLELGIGRGGLRVPSGLISGQKLFFLLRKFALPVSGIDDFDDLPIPFRAVATDIETGEVVVLEDGDLARAMRASMAIPGAFAAVDLDGRRLVDGGVVNNLPIDIVRAMGADIVIAIDLGTPISERGEIQSFVQILGQTTSMITRSNVRRQLPDADLVLNPYVRDFGILEFESATAIIEKGVEEARAHVVDLEPYALDEASYAAHRAARPTPPPLPTTVDFIEYRGNERVDSRIIDAQLDVRPGDPLDLDTVAEDLGRVYGLGDFEAVEVSLATRATAEGEVEYGLIIDIREKDWGPTYLHGGLSLTSDFEGEGFDFGLLVNVNRTRLNARGGEWRNDLLVGQRRRLVSELYQPLDFNGRFFVAPSIDILRDRVGLFEGGEEISKLDLESNILRLDVGYQAGRFGEFRLGLYRGTAEAAVDIGRE